MQLPETALLNFFNKILVSLEDLTKNGVRCDKNSLLTQCQSITFGGVRGDYEAILSHCKYCGLLSIKGTDVSISTLGSKFLSANRERFFEITEAQKQIIIERIVFKGAWSQYARELFSFFSANPQTALYEVSKIESVIPSNQDACIHFFKYIGLLEEDGYLIKVDRKYTQLVYELTADGKAISEQQLEQLLMENRKLGAQAEIRVVEFEKQRLIKLGKYLQADLVRRISTLNTAAGYDIESFDGIGEDVFPNRFIEVKATTNDEIRFYWTINERNVASIKKEAYWIYVYSSFKETEDVLNSCPIMIQNPDSVIPSHGSFNMEVNKYYISAFPDVTLVEQKIDELKWYTI